MKNKFTFTVFLSFLLLPFLNSKVVAQDLISCTTCWITSNYTFSSSTNEVTIVDMVIKNQGWFDATAFEFAIFIKDVNTGIEYEIDRVNYSGLGFQTNQNQIPITNMVVDLDNKPQVPSGTYRVEGRINDNKNATETNYTNNTEYFGNASFVYTSLSAGVNDFEGTLSYLSIYPNPFSSVATLQTDKAFKDATLTVHNLDGQTVKQIDNISGQTIILHRDNLPSGLYFIRLTQDSKVIAINKLVITD